MPTPRHIAAPALLLTRQPRRLSHRAARSSLLKAIPRAAHIVKTDNPVATFDAIRAGPHSSFEADSLLQSKTPYWHEPLQPSRSIKPNGRLHITCSGVMLLAGLNP